MKKLAIIFIIVLLLFLFFKGQAQEVISAAGTNGTSATVQLSWTIGEPVIETSSKSNIILTQGFHQSRLTITAKDPSTLSGMAIHVFPNPALTEVTLSISKGFIQGLLLTLVNTEGKILLSKEVKNACESINLEWYPPGVYILRVQHAIKPGFQTFSIVKH
jgi:hypothetical protein